MIKIAITPENRLADEQIYIRSVIDAGWQWVHLRHPSSTEDEMRRLIESIDRQCYPKIKLHSFPHLVEEYHLGGFHLNSHTPSTHLNPNLYSISRSCHCIEELNYCKGFDYVTLSPIFDSLSKQGYHSNFTLQQLASLPSSPKIIALGGITPERISELSQYNFAGYAVLGYLAKATSPDQLTTLLSQFN